MDKLSLIILLLCITGLHFINAKMTPVRKLVRYPTHTLMINRFYHVEDKIAYAVCDRQDITKEHNERNCTIIREKFPFQDPPYTCNITFRTEYENGELASFFSVVPFGKENVVVTWSERDMPLRLKLTTIKMSSCKTTETSVFTQESSEAYPLVVAAAQFTGYTDYYDVFFKNETLCKAGTCKLTIDADSNIINGPVGFYPYELYSLSYKFWRALSVDSPNEGLFYVGRSLEEDDIVYSYRVMQPNGTETSIMKTKENNNTPVAASTTNGLITVCFQELQNNETHALYNCTQNKKEGDLKHLTFFAHGEWYKILDLYNLPTGGFLILALNKIDPDTNNLLYTLMKVDSDGEKYTQIEVAHQEGLFGYNAQAFQNADKEYCVTMLTYAMGKYSENYIDLYADCFTDDDFSS